MRMPACHSKINSFGFILLRHELTGADWTKAVHVNKSFEKGVI